jgi:hypothetical protein
VDEEGRGHLYGADSVISHVVGPVGMDSETLILVATALGAIAALVVWAMKRYETIMADGKVTLDEVISVLKDGEKEVDATAAAVEEAVEAVKDAVDDAKGE